MKFNVLKFDSVKDRNVFLNIYFPDREKIEKSNSYQITEDGAIVVDGKQILFLSADDPFA
jgi:hypothetical protein